MEWQPIETAPKDEDDVLLWIPDSGGGYFEIAFWRNDASAWDTMEGWLEPKPSHWMRPAPPDTLNLIEKEAKEKK